MARADDEDERRDDVGAGARLDALEARLAALKLKMLSGLPARADELEAAVSRLDTAEPDARDELRRLGHKLRGVAGSYGLAELGALSGSLEAAARDVTLEVSGLRARALELAQRARRAARQEEHPATTPARGPLEAAGGASPAFGAERPEGVSLAGRLVLGADDDDATRRLLSLTFFQMGRMRGGVVEGGQQLLAALEREARVDFVVVDAMMPEMNGLEVLRALVERGLEGRVGRFAILSAAAPEELGWVIPAGLEVGWLRKPFRPKDLLDALRALVLDASPAR